MRSFLFIVTLTIAISFGCTYKSSGSQSSAVEGTTAVQASPAPATPTQEKVPCTLRLAAAPTINGLHLGMTPDEVLALFPGSQDDAEVKTSLSRPPSEFGVSGFLIRPGKYQTNDQFAGINQITFSVLDGRVANLSVGYNGPEYPHVDKFVEKFVDGRSLPTVDQWEAYVGMDNQLKTLTCAEFEVRVFAGGQGGNLNYVLIKDLIAEKKLKDRRAKARAEASPTPKQ